MRTLTTSARKSLVAGLFFVTALGPMAASAQPQDRAQAAQAAFRHGIAEMDGHRFQAALGALEESYRLYPSPVALYNIALAHRELGHTQQAIASFERYLSEGGTRLPSDRVSTVRDAIRALHDQLVTLAFSVTPAGFSTLVDGRDTPTSNGLFTLDPGDHVVVVTAPDHRPWREELHLGPGQRVQRSIVLVAESSAPVAPTTPVVPATPVGAQTPAVSPVAVVPAQTPHPRDEAASAPITSRWWFWTGISAVVVGGVIMGVVLATQSPTPAPLVSGTAFDVQTIRTR